MKGIGGPLLCIGDLLSDVGEEERREGEGVGAQEIPNSSNASAAALSPADLDLSQVFQENYDSLNKAFAGTGQSWTSLTLKLCTTLETANKFVLSSSSNVRLLSEKVGELEKTIKRGDAAIAAAKDVNATLNQNHGKFSGSGSSRK